VSESTSWPKDDYVVSTDPARIDLDVVLGFLTTSYWASTRTREECVIANERSRCFGVYHEPTGAQVGFCRVLTDDVTFGWVADVFVLEEHRGQGLARFLMECVMGSHQHVRRMVLGTRDAHGLYAQVGFEPLRSPERFMERFTI
jgi:GNAT superfamily N-acetyltransferase